MELESSNADSDIPIKDPAVEDFLGKFDPNLFDDDKREIISESTFNKLNQIIVRPQLFNYGLSSESFSLWMKSPEKCAKKYLKEYRSKEKMIRIVFDTFFVRFEPK